MKKNMENDVNFDALLGALSPVIREYAINKRTKDCPAEEKLSRYIDKDLPEAEMKALKKHSLYCPYCSVALLDLINLKRESPPADQPWVIDFVKDAVRVISEPFTFYPAALQPSVMRGGKKEYKGSKISRIWKIAKFDVRITAEKQKKGEIKFFIRILDSKKPLANETVKLGRESAVTDRQGLAEFTVKNPSMRRSITLNIPAFDKKVRIGLRSIR